MRLSLPRRLGGFPARFVCTLPYRVTSGSGLDYALGMSTYVECPYMEKA